MELGGAGFRLNPAAVSALRYRAAYGDSVANHLARCETGTELEKTLLRMCRVMIPPAQRPAPEDFARLARRDAAFFQKALAARDALLAPDPLRPPGPEDEAAEPFDEYEVLALAAAAGVGMELIYEVPILHLAAVAGRVFALRSADQKQYRPMTQKEMAELYPRGGGAYGAV